MRQLPIFGRKHSGALKVRDFSFDVKAVGDDGTFNGYGKFTLPDGTGKPRVVVEVLPR